MLFDLVVVGERHAFVVVVADAVAAVVAGVHVVVLLMLVWQTDDCDLGWMSPLRHRTNRMEMVMGTVVTRLLALGSSFGTLGSIHSVPTVATVTINRVDADRTGI